MGPASHEPDAADPVADNETVRDTAGIRRPNARAGSSHRGRWIVAALLAIALAAFGGGALWWYGSVHPAMDLSGTSVIKSCVTRQTPTERDLVTGEVTFSPPADVELLSINLLDPVNVTIADALIAPVVSPSGGGFTIQG